MLVRQSFLSQSFLQAVWLSVVSEQGLIFSISIHLLCFSIHSILNFLKTPCPGSPDAGREYLSQSCGFSQSRLPCIIFQLLSNLIIPTVGKVWLVDESKQLCNKSQGQTNFLGRPSLCIYIAFSVINKVINSAFHLDEKF